MAQQQQQQLFGSLSPLTVEFLEKHKDVLALEANKNMFRELLLLFEKHEDNVCKLTEILEARYELDSATQDAVLQLAELVKPPSALPPLLPAKEEEEGRERPASPADPHVLWRPVWAANLLLTLLVLAMLCVRP